MALGKQDELNNLAIPYETYFGEMGLSKEEIKRRIEFAEMLDDVFIMLFSLAAAEKIADRVIDAEFLAGYAERHFWDVLDYFGIDYIETYPWLKTHVRQTAEEVVSQIEKNPDDSWQLSNDRAMLIAENEANSVYEYKGFQDAVDSGKTRKTWNTMLDNKVRHTHEVNESLTIPIMDRFHVGAYEMYQPKDTSCGAGMEEIAGCRCWCTYS